MMTSKKMNLSTENGIGILGYDGEIVFENSNLIKERAKKAIEKKELNKLIFDLSSVPYLDSSGIGVVLSLFKFMRMKGGELVVSGLNEKSKRVFEVTQINEIIDIFSDAEIAREKLRETK